MFFVYLPAFNYQLHSHFTHRATDPHNFTPFHALIENNTSVIWLNEFRLFDVFASACIQKRIYDVKKRCIRKHYQMNHFNLSTTVLVYFISRSEFFPVLFYSFIYLRMQSFLVVYRVGKKFFRHKLSVSQLAVVPRTHVYVFCVRLCHYRHRHHHCCRE